jgi:hypothetical protein
VGLAKSLFLFPSEVSKSLKRGAETGLLHIAHGEKRIKRSALMELLRHGFKYVFPPAKGSLDDGDPREIWPYVEGKARPGPLYSSPSSTVFSISVMRYVVGERESETSRSNCSARRSMPDPNLLRLEDTCRGPLKAIQFQDHESRA